MDRQAALALGELNNRFYESVAASFSSTRQSAWPGWERVAALVREELAGAGRAGREQKPYSVLDVASGNGRFERFLAGELPERQLLFHTVDACDELAAEATLEALPSVRAEHRRLDVTRRLLLDEEMPSLGTGPFDLAVSFAFLHHVPTEAARMRGLRLLLDHARPGGLVALSLWMFAERPGARRKAQQATERALASLSGSLPYLPGQLEEGDYLLGWQGRSDAFRYCHSFTEGEIDRLITSLGTNAELLARWRADGRSGADNCYLIFRNDESIG